MRRVRAGLAIISIIAVMAIFAAILILSGRYVLMI